MFLVFGAITLAWSVMVFFFLPDTPMQARFLAREDRAKAAERVRENMGGTKDNVFKMRQAMEASFDVKIWLLVLIQLATNVANGAVQSVSLGNATSIPSNETRTMLSLTPAATLQFSSIVIRGFGFSTLTTLLVQMISTAFQFVFVATSAFGSSYFANTRTYFIVANLGIALIGTAMIRQIDADRIWTRFAGFCLQMSFTANFPIVLSLSSANVAGFTKRSTANAMVGTLPYLSGHSYPSSPIQHAHAYQPLLALHQQNSSLCHGN